MRHTRVLLVALAALPVGLVLTACEPAPLVITPSNAQTVADGSQVTGRRVNLPLPDCTTRTSDCNEIRLLNQLDGFDLDPRISLGFSGNIDVAKVTDQTVYVERNGTTERTGLNRLVWDDTTDTLYGQPKTFLRESTIYRVVVTTGVNGQSGESTFTTMSATLPLRKMRTQLGDGTAYTAAGIPVDQQSLRLGTTGTQLTTFPAATVVRPRRFNDLQVGDADAPMEEQVFNSAQSLPADAGTYAFGSFTAPSWLEADRTIPQVPTGGSGPTVRGSEEIGFVAILPADTPAHPKPPGGWPVAVFGPGVTRSKYDVFLASDELLKQGIATIAIDPVGHAYGPDSQAGVDLALPPGMLRFDGFGRAVDVDGDGQYSARDGLGTRGQPSTKAAISLRDGLRQTALDNMALSLAIGRGADLDGTAGVDLRPTGVTYFAQSLGGIYGTMLMGTDPAITTGVLNVPGGPILDIARLAPGFRPDVATELGNRRPSLLNGGDSGFTESQPLYSHRPQRFPVAGALEIQAVGARTNWLNRPGSPEAYAPLLRLRPVTTAGAKKVLYQFAFGDGTVPNPTSAAIMRAGALQDVTTFYRNDRTPTAGSDPHGFLLDPRIAGRQMGQMQVAAFLRNESGTIIDPDGAGNVFEEPITDPATLEACNFAGSAGLERCTSPK